MVAVLTNWELFQISHTNSLRLGISNLITSAFADVAADIDDEDLIGHVDLAFVHVVEHGFGAFGPDFVVSAVAEQTDGDDDVASRVRRFCASRYCSLNFVLQQRVITLYLPTIILQFLCTFRITADRISGASPEFPVRTSSHD